MITMRTRRFVVYPNYVILTRTQTSLLLMLACFCLSNLQIDFVRCLEEDHQQQHEEIIETISRVDPKTKLTHEEYAFRAPMKGLPHQAIDVFCASVKMRLFWGVYRDEIKATHRKGLYMRRMGRLAKHIFEDIRDVDKPFNATMLYQPDKYFAASQDPEVGDEPMDDSTPKTIKKPSKLARAGKSKLKSLKTKLVNGLHRTSSGDQTSQLEALKEASKIAVEGKDDKDKGDDDDNKDEDRDSGQDEQNKSEMASIENSEAMMQLDEEGNVGAKKRIKKFLKKWAPKVALGIYTRWRTMWWMMMSCLFAKYYLWDPALDEFTKLKRNLVMWPEFQLVKMQQLSCKPLQLFRRLLDVCKIMNPLMHIDFGTLSLDKMTRFK